MLPVERQEYIKALIREKPNLKISELSKTLEVSDMTIHRDLKPLIDDGTIVKTFGGISLVQQPGRQGDLSGCVFCSRTIEAHLAYRLVLEDGTIEVTCCAHCGLLRHRQLQSNVSQALCQDFFRHTTISARQAWYVMDTSISIDCCKPQVLTFERKEHADKFVLGFGGIVYPFQQAMKTVYQKMNDCDYSQCTEGEWK